MNRWQQLRGFFLVVTFSGVISVLGKIILYPTSTAQQAVRPAPFVFPPDVSLPGWQPLASRPLTSDSTKSQKFISGQLYQYEQNGRSLDIEMRYTIETSGNVMGFVGNYTAIPSSAIQPSSRIDRYKKSVGYYILFTHEKRAYLTSCINPRGDSTVTLPQFQHNRYTYDIQPDRVFRWLFRQENIRDLRCLWVHSSIPLDGTSPENAYPILEKAWVSWYQWWQPRFPKP